MQTFGKAVIATCARNVLTWNVRSHSASSGGGLLLDGILVRRSWDALVVLIVPKLCVCGGIISLKS